MLKNTFRLLVSGFIVINCSACRQQPIANSIMPQHARQTLLQKMTDWQAEGRVAIQEGSEAQNASFKWEQNQEYFRVYFYSPFSSESVTISGTGNQINVTTANGPTQEEVSLERELPLAQLTYWVKGIPAPGSTPEACIYDSYNQLQKLQQDSWIVVYQSYQATIPVSLPEKLTLTNGATKVKLLIKNWRK